MPLLVEELVEEHLAIRRALETLLLGSAVHRLLGDPRALEEILPIYQRFSRTFITSCHHAKEEKIAGFLAEKGHRVQSLDLEKEHEELEKLIGEILGAPPRGWGEDLGSKVARYYSTLKDHINREDARLVPEIEMAAKLTKSEEMVKKIMEDVEESLGHGVHEQSLGLVEEMEKILRRVLENRKARVVNVLEVPPFKRHELIKVSIKEMISRGERNLILINDHEPAPLYYELSATEPCFDQDNYRAEPLGDNIWTALLPLRERCER